MKKLPWVDIEEKIFSVKFYVDEEVSHLQLKDKEKCKECLNHPCLDFCPAGVYSLDKQGYIQISYQSCLECGSCRVGCPFKNIAWKYPRGGMGLAYKFG